jgi:hypothetical protein
VLFMITNMVFVFRHSTAGLRFDDAALGVVNQSQSMRRNVPFNAGHAID